MEQKKFKEPKFKPKPGQADYRNIRWTPVVNSIVKYKGKILLVWRNENLHFYPECWNGISGFLDDAKSLEEKVYEELREELSVPRNKVKTIVRGAPFDQEEPKYKKTWVVHPVMVTITTDKIKLDWEAKKYIWTTPKEVKRLKLLPGFDRVFKTFFK